MTTTTTASSTAPVSSATPPPATTAAPGDSGDGGGQVPEPEFTALEDWLAEYFLPMFRRTLGGEYRWCRQWWRHGEAISRLNALWHSWEVLRTQPGTGIGVWYREHLDHQLPVLLGARGPFCQCSEQVHREPHEAAADPAPPGWWERAGGPGGSAAADSSSTGGGRDDSAVTGRDGGVSGDDDA